jgi:hypothetical protein
MPLALLGFSPWMIATQKGISLVYQYWIHTEAIRRLPKPIEAVFNTPSHHRVHHASNPEYLNRNYGGVLILFDRLFGNAMASDHAGESRDQQETYNRSILDYTKDSLTKINDQLGANDRHRVDEYLTGIREIEHRLDAPPSDIKLPKGVVRPLRVPDTFKEHFGLMADLQILAFQMDATRISTFMLGVEQSRRTYNEIGIPEEHHGLTHHAGDPEKIKKVVAIDTYMAENFAIYLDKMKKVKEGDKTMLDNAMVLLGKGQHGDGAGTARRAAAGHRLAEVHRKEFCE